MNKPKSIQIPQNLFIELIQYFMYGVDSKERHEHIKSQLDAKLDRIIEHDLYTQYKTAPTDEQREAARKEYIERKDIPKGFRW